jgi:hypothetical protein
MNLNVKLNANFIKKDKFYHQNDLTIQKNDGSHKTLIG